MSITPRQRRGVSTRGRGLVPLAIALCAAALTACAGQVDDGTKGPPEAPPPSGAGGAPAPGGAATPGGGAPGAPAAPASARRFGAAGLRRLTAFEIENAVRDVFFPAGAFALEGFQEEAGKHEFDNVASGLHMSLGFAESVAANAERIAAGVVAALPKLLPCSAGVTAANEAACAGAFIDLYGRRLFRRPVAAEDRQRLAKVFADVRKVQPFPDAVGAVVETMVQSPRFLFRSELGGKPDARRLARLEPFEVAAALSFFLQRTTPDEQLLEAAESGALATPEGIRAQARRLVDADAGKRGVRDFFMQWTEAAVARTIRKDDPAFSAELARAAYDESAQFFERVVWKEKGGLPELLRSTATVANADLARVYGLPAPRGAGLAPVTLDAGKRSGFLTQPAFLMAHQSPGEFSPIFLGRFMRVRLLCQDLAPPPPDIPEPPRDAGLSTRDKFQMHASSGACRGCHQQMDPIGWGFEQYDVIGRRREAEVRGGKTIPLSGQGELIGTDVDGAFTGPVDLAAKLAGSAQVKDCVAGQLLSFMTGRAAYTAGGRLDSDAASIAAALAATKTASLTELMVALTTTDAFLLRDQSQLGSL
jgi:hypothetical protein